MTVKATWGQVTRSTDESVLPRSASIIYGGKLGDGTYRVVDATTAERDQDVEYGDLVEGDIIASSTGYDDSVKVEDSIRVNNPPVIADRDVNIVRGSTVNQRVEAAITDEREASVRVTILSATGPGSQIVDPVDNQTVVLQNHGSLPIGSRTVIRVRATDEYGETDSATYTVNVVRSDTSPRWLSSLPRDVSLEVGQTYSLNLSSHAIDDEGDAMTFSITHPDYTFATITFNATTSVLEITGVSTGTGTIMATVTAGGKSAEADISFTITPGTVNPLTCNRVDVDLGTENSATVTMSDYVTGASSPDFNVIGLDSPHVYDLTTGVLTVRRDGAESEWQQIATYTVTDGSRSCNNVIRARWDRKPNRAPEWLNTLPTDITMETNATRTITLSDHARDIDGDDLEYTVAPFGSRPVTFTLNGDVLTMQSGTTEGRGSATVTVTDDPAVGTALSDTETITVEVERAAPPPDPLRCSRVDVDLGLNDRTAEVSLADYITGSASPTITVSNLSSPHSYNSATDTLVVARVGASGVWHTVGAYTATDGSRSCTNSIRVRWDEPANRAPSWDNSLPTDIELSVNGSRSIDLSDYASDPDGDTLSYSLSNRVGRSATFALSGSTLTITAGSTTGSSSVDVVVSDGSLSDDETISVDVQRDPDPVPSCPVVHITIPAGSQFTEVDLDFLDPSGAGAQAYTVRANSGHSVRGTTFRANRRPGHVAGRTYTAGSYTSTNSAGSCTGTITYEWTPSTNRPPVWTTPVSVSVDPSTRTGIFDMRRFVSDPDGDTLTYSVGSQSRYIQLATISIIGTLSVTVTSDATDRTDNWVNVTADDGKGGRATVTVTVLVDGE